MIDHDAKPGPLKRCQITGSENLNLVIDLGHQPLCDALLSAEQLDQPEATYPLRLMHCPESGLAQLDYVVDGREVYPPDYPYKAGISWPVAAAHRAMAKELVYRFGPLFCCDIGSNDGTMLAEFEKLGCRVLGVEPTNIGKLAKVETMQCFFDEAVAAVIRSDNPVPTLVTMTNVFAHMAGLGEVMRGVRVLLGDDGVFVTESHYLLDVMKKNQFDTIYHEHIRTYSLKAIKLLVEQYGLEVFDVERPDRYGGNLRAFIAPAGSRAVSSSVSDLLRLEELEGLHVPETWKLFRTRVLYERDRFMEFLYSAHRDGLSVAGNSCPGRSSTLLNFYGVTPDLMSYLAELPASLKSGKYAPGSHIPIIENSIVRESPPDYLVLLAWHYFGPIMDRLGKEGVKTKVVVPLPHHRVIDMMGATC